VRGKQKLGYELDLEITLGAIIFRLIEVCDHEDDAAEFRAISGDSSVMRTRRRDIVGSIKEALEQYRLSIV
jgi:hypothetical protein